MGFAPKSHLDGGYGVSRVLNGLFQRVRMNGFGKADFGEIPLEIDGGRYPVYGVEGGFYRLLDMAFTTMNVEGDVAANLIIAKSVGEYDASRAK